jgi:hypothetical protein
MARRVHLDLTVVAMAVDWSRAYKEWQVGIALFAIGNILNFVSFGNPLVPSVGVY